MPRKPSEEGAKLAPLNIRTTQDRRERLEAAAKASGRSLTQQVERYLDMAMDMEHRLGGEQLFDAMTLIGEAAAHVLANTRTGLDDYRTRARVIAAIASSAEWAIPAAGLYETGDLKEVAEAVEELRTILPYVMPDFDPQPLFQLLNGYPLPDWLFDAYYNAIVNAEPQYQHDPKAMSVLGTAKATLVSAQDRVRMIANSVQEQAQAGRVDAFTLFARGQQS